jgi:heterodisulfide reductase subunit A2
MITFKLNGQTVQGEEGQYILQVAEKMGVPIPTLCNHKALDPAGMCRMCTVEVFDGRRTRYVTACNYPIWEGMEVKTDTDIVREGRKLIAEMLLARCPESTAIQKLAKGYGIETPRFKTGDDTCILCGLCTRMCERMGANAITLTHRGLDLKIDTPFSINTEACIACGACAFVCPTGHITYEKIKAQVTQKPGREIPSEYDMGLKGRKPVYVPYAQAVPNTPVIDREVCIHFKTGGCKVCAEFCGVDAIDHSMQDETVVLNVGAIILAPGFEAFDPSRFDTYNYAQHPNVITALEMERILSASGPTQGHLARLSDHKEPKKIAWFQCVGSRDMNKCDNAHCSSVCCMYAIKEAVIAKEHAGGDWTAPSSSWTCAPTARISNASTTPHAKSTACASSAAGSTPSTRSPAAAIWNCAMITEQASSRRNLRHGGALVGMQTSKAVGSGPKAGDRADRRQVLQDRHLQPRRHLTAGDLCVRGVPGPQGHPPGGRRLQCGRLGRRRDPRRSPRHLTKTKELVPETNVVNERPRIGVFVCRCGINIAGVVDVPAVRDYAAGLPYVEYVSDNLYSCSQDTQENMSQIIKQKNLNRVVVAACTPKTHEPLFQETCVNAGLNKYLFEMANIRNQDSWVHKNSPQLATARPWTWFAWPSTRWR